MISSILVAIIVLISALYWWGKRKEPANPPPGPKGALPFVGHMYMFMAGYGTMMTTMKKWCEEFPIFQIELPTSKLIVLSDHNLVKELFASETFSGRGGVNNKFMDMHTEGDMMHGIMSAEGPQWDTLRRFTIKNLRDFGFGRNSMETSIMEEVNELLEWMKTQEGKSIDGIKEKYIIAVVNSLWSIMSGKRYSHDDKILLDLTERLQKSLTNVAETGGLLFFAPWIRHIFPEKSGFNYIRRILGDLRDFFSVSISEHKETLQEDQPRDYIDAFLTEINQTKNEKSPFYGKTGERHLISCISDLFGAGTDTTSTTLAWLNLYLSTFPEVQKQLQDEIQRVVGNTRTCALSDRPEMPYTQAVLAEVMRCSSIQAMGVHHGAVTEDAQFHGYTIPKDIMILANLYFIHHNPKIWGDPENFRPQRFLSPDGKTFKKHEALMPFSAGKRQCLGEQLARDTLFLFTTNIFQRFDVKLDPNAPNPGLDHAVGLLMNTKPFKIIVKDRFD